MVTERPVNSGGTRRRWWGSGQDRGLEADADAVLLAGLVAAAALGLVVAAVGVALSAVTGGARLTAASVAAGVAAVVAHPRHPGGAWVSAVGGRPVAAAVWWGTTGVVVAAAGGMGVVVWRRQGRRRGPWGDGSALRRLRLRRGDRGRLVVGRSGRRLVAVEARHSVLVFGPTQSGKTSGFAVPAILEWPGTVVATSTKADLVRDTIGWRSTLGPALVFDPTGCSGFAASGWSPLAGCDSWDGCVRVAWELAMAGKAAVGGRMSLADFWFAGAAKALAGYLRAAAVAGGSMGDVAQWVDDEERVRVRALLRDDDSGALSALEATFRREERARSSLFQVMQQIVGAYLDPVVAASAGRADIVADDVVGAGVRTLYVTAPLDDQARLRPLFSTLIGQVVAAAYRRSAALGGPLDPPLLVVLDEAANIAPVDDLPAIASTASAMGVQLVSVFQDLAQVRGRYGDGAGTVVNNHRAKLFLPGTADMDTLRLVSGLVGDQEVERLSSTTDPFGRRSSTTTSQWRPSLPPEEACRMEDGSAVLVYGNLAPLRLRLRPWFKDRRLRRRAGVRFAPPPAGGAASSAAGADGEQTRAGQRALSIIEAARGRVGGGGGE